MTYRLALCATAALALAGSSDAQTYTGLTGKDASSTTQTVCTVAGSGSASGQMPCSILHWYNGTSTVVVSPTNPLAVYSTVVPPGGAAVTGSASTTGNTAVTVLTAPGASVANNVASWQCWNSSSTAITISFNDTASTQIYLPGTYGNNFLLPAGIPLTFATNTAAQFTPSASVTSAGCAFQGWKK